MSDQRPKRTFKETYPDRYETGERILEREKLIGKVAEFAHQLAQENGLSEEDAQYILDQAARRTS